MIKFTAALLTATVLASSAFAQVTPIPKSKNIEIMMVMIMLKLARL